MSPLPRLGSVALVLPLLLAGCTDDPGPSAADLFRQDTIAHVQSAMVDDMAILTAVHVTGSISDLDGKQIPLDVSLDRDGNCTGQLTLHGQKVRFVGGAGAVYVKATRAYWRSTERDDLPARLLSSPGAWLRTPFANSGFAQWCDLDGLLELLRVEVAPAATRGGEEQVGGQSALDISEMVNFRTDHAWVAVDSPHRLLRLERQPGTGPFTLLFDAFDTPVAATLPTGGNAVRAGLKEAMDCPQCPYLAGGSAFVDESVAQILIEARAAMNAISSMRVRVDGSLDDKSMSMDVRITSGGDCSGAMQYGTGHVEILVAGDGRFMKGDEQFWRETVGANASYVIDLLGDKWAKLPADEASVDDLCDTENLFRAFNYNIGNTVRVERIGVRTIGGETALGLHDGSQKTTMWIAIEPDHHVLLIELKQRRERAAVQFSAFDEKFRFRAPGSEDYVDLG